MKNDFIKLCTSLFGHKEAQMDFRGLFKTSFKSLFRLHLVLSLGLLSGLCFTSVSQADEADEIFFGEEVNCSNLEQQFKEYSSVINLLQISFSQSLSKLQSLAKKMRNKELSDKELDALDTEISKTQNAMAENELFLSEVSWKIEDVISDCIN